MGSQLDTLKKRADFLKLSRAYSFSQPGVVVQFLRRVPLESPNFPVFPLPSTIRVGFTVTRKLGGAVVRNRIKRRLREAVRSVYGFLEEGCDYVFVGRKATLTKPFFVLCQELRFCVLSLHKKSHIGVKQQEKDA